MSDVKVTFGGDASDLSKTLDKIKKDIGSLKNTAMAAAGGAIGMIAKKIGSEALSDVQTLDEIGKKSANLGVTTDFYQRMAYAADESGTSIEAVHKAFVNFSSEMEEGSKSVKENLNGVGLAYDDLLSMSPEERFMKVAEAINKLGTESRKLQAGKSLFGKAGEGMGVMLDKFEDSKNVTMASISAIKKAEDSLQESGDTYKSGKNMGFNASAALVDWFKGTPTNNDAELAKQRKQFADAAKMQAELTKQENEAKKKSEAATIVSDTIGDLEKSVTLQELKNKGLLKEAYIQEQLQKIKEKLKDKELEMTPDQEAKIRGTASSLYDVQNITQPPDNPNNGLFANELMRMGGRSEAGMTVGKWDKWMELDVRRNELLKSLATRDKNRDTKEYNSKTMSVTLQE